MILLLMIQIKENMIADERKQFIVLYILIILSNEFKNVIDIMDHIFSLILWATSPKQFNSSNNTAVFSGNAA